jgi:DNA-binding CsgD family transcriptional regulator
MPDKATAELVGRRADLEALSEFLDGIPSGAAGFVLEGDAGIGKTTLLSAALSHAKDRGYRVLSSSPAPPDEALSFSGLEDLLHDVVDEVAPVLPQPQLRALEVALLLRDPEGEPPGPLAVALAVRGTLVGLAQRGPPVVVAVDDSQWLDDSSAAAVGHAVRRLGAAPIGLLAALQSEGVRRPDSALVTSLPSDTRRHRVGPMDTPDLRTLLRSRLGLSLSGVRAERLHRACSGNPLAALEIGRAILESGDAEPSGPAMPVPEELADLLRRRIETLTAREREALLVVAAFSDPPRSLVEAVVGGEAGSALAGAVLKGLLEEEEGVLRFPHPLFGLVLYSNADPQDRRRLHRRLAGLIGDPQDRAMHLALSVDGYDEKVAAEVEAAARTARDRGAPSAAAELCEQARRLTPPEMSAEANRRVLLEAEYHLDSGDLDRSGELLEGILASTEAGPTRAAALERLGWVRYHQDSWSSASLLFEQAAAEADRAPALLAAVELDRAVASLVAGDIPGAATHAAASLDQARALHDAPLVAASSALVASVDFLLGRGVAEDVMEQAIAAETWSRPRPTAARPSVAFGVLLKWSDQLARSRALLEEARRRAEESGAERSLPFILFHLAEVECWLGDWVEAERHAEIACDSAERTAQQAGRAFGLSAQALVQAHRGREEDARAAATEGLALASAAGALPAAVVCESALGLLELSLGRADRAHRHFAPLIEGAAAGGMHEPGAMRYLADALEALVSVGDVELAARLVEELHARSEELGRTWGLMAAASCRALLLAATGDLPGARASIEASVVYLDGLSQPFELGRTLLVRGTIERRDRRKRSARESLERALEIFSELGADLWIDRARGELTRIGGRAASSVSLTPTEERIVRLVVEGATNQEVASSLFLSVKTVEWNLSRVYRKLGVRSRVELARWMAAPTGSGPSR